MSGAINEGRKFVFIGYKRFGLQAEWTGRPKVYSSQMLLKAA
jgi:hypothetical protein